MCPAKSPSSTPRKAPRCQSVPKIKTAPATPPPSHVYATLVDLRSSFNSACSYWARERSRNMYERNVWASRTAQTTEALVVSQCELRVRFFDGVEHNMKLMQSAAAGMHMTVDSMLRSMNPPSMAECWSVTASDAETTYEAQLRDEMLVYENHFNNTPWLESFKPSSPWWADKVVAEKRVDAVQRMRYWGSRLRDRVNKALHTIEAERRVRKQRRLQQARQESESKVQLKPEPKSETELANNHTRGQQHQQQSSVNSIPPLQDKQQEQQRARSSLEVIKELMKKERQKREQVSEREQGREVEQEHGDEPDRKNDQEHNDEQVQDPEQACKARQRDEAQQRQRQESRQDSGQQQEPKPKTEPKPEPEPEPAPEPEPEQWQEVELMSEPEHGPTQEHERAQQPTSSQAPEVPQEEIEVDDEYIWLPESTTNVVWSDTFSFRSRKGN